MSSLVPPKHSSLYFSLFATIILCGLSPMLYGDLDSLYCVSFLPNRRPVKTIIFKLEDRFAVY